MRALVVLITVSSFLIVGCEAKDPAPEEAPKAEPAAAEKAEPAAADKAEPAAADKAEPAAAGQNQAPAPGAEAAAAGGDCPSELKSYSSFVDEYIAYMEKVGKGDLTALNQAQPLMQKAQKAGQDLQRANLQGGCLQEFVAIQGRMTKAAARMAGAAPPDIKQLEVANEQLGKAAGKAANQMACIQGCNSVTDPAAKMACIQGCQ